MDYFIFPMMFLYINVHFKPLGHQIIILTFVLLPVHALILIHLCLVLFVIGTPYPPLLLQVLLIYFLHVAFGYIFISTLLFLCPLYIQMHIYKNSYRKKKYIYIKAYINSH